MNLENQTIIFVILWLTLADGVIKFSPHRLLYQGEKII